MLSTKRQTRNPSLCLYFWFIVVKFIDIATDTHLHTHNLVQLRPGYVTTVVPKVMSNFILHANWEQQTKESAVVDGTSCCVILECLVMSIACIT